MDKRPSSEEREAKEDQISEINEAEGVPQETEANAGKNPVTEDGKDDPSELSKFRVYVLLLGTDSQRLTKYVEKVMVAKSRLMKMGWSVAGAFISAKALKTNDPGKRAVPKTGIH